jgi:hypothetical protein
MCLAGLGALGAALATFGSYLFGSGPAVGIACAALTGTTAGWVWGKRAVLSTSPLLTELDRLEAAVLRYVAAGARSRLRECVWQQDDPAACRSRAYAVAASADVPEDIRASAADVLATLDEHLATAVEDGACLTGAALDAIEAVVRRFRLQVSAAVNPLTRLLRSVRA